jgi:hypothetical protein
MKCIKLENGPVRLPTDASNLKESEITPGDRKLYNHESSIEQDHHQYEELGRLIDQLDNNFMLHSNQSCIDPLVYDDNKGCS